MTRIVFILLIFLPLTASGFDVTKNSAVQKRIVELRRVIEEIGNSTAVMNKKRELQKHIDRIRLVEKQEKQPSFRKILPEGEKIYILISSSVPLETLRAYVQEAEKFNDFIFVIRGTIGTVSKIRPTLFFIRKIIARNDKEAYKVEFNLDPLPFRLIHAEFVPAFLLVKDGKPEAVVYGDVSLSYAVKKLYENTCDPYLKKFAEILGESPGLCSVRFSEKAGTVYPIKEKDIISEIKKRARAINREALLKRMREKVYSWQPDTLQVLPPAHKKRVYTFVPVYTLKHSIPRVDRNGHIVGVLYPAGYTFNPLAYIQLPVIVFFNGEREKEVRWIKKHLHDFSNNTLFCTTSGQAWKLSEQIGRRVYYATKDMLEKFHVRESISICRKKRDAIEVTVVPVD